MQEISCRKIMKNISPYFYVVVDRKTYNIDSSKKF